MHADMYLRIVCTLICVHSTVCVGIVCTLHIRTYIMFIMYVLSVFICMKYSSQDSSKGYSLKKVNICNSYPYAKLILPYPIRTVDECFSY